MRKSEVRSVSWCEMIMLKGREGRGGMKCKNVLMLYDLQLNDFKDINNETIIILLILMGKSDTICPCFSTN